MHRDIPRQGSVIAARERHSQPNVRSLDGVDARKPYSPPGLCSSDMFVALSCITSGVPCEGIQICCGDGVCKDSC
jgi:hypothetical protein